MNSNINPKMITWARKRTGYSINDLAIKLNKDPKDIESWEDGTTVPSYSNLEKLAYKYLKIPIALFFFPEPPNIEYPIQKFRRLPSYELQKFSPNTLEKISIARGYQDSLYLLLEDLVPDKKIFKDIVTENINPIELAEKARLYLNIDVKQQINFESPEKAFKAWRHSIEIAGVFTFKDSFVDRFISGFSILDTNYPIIFINNSNSFSRQLFTLIHELGHILYGVGGVTDADESYLRFMNAEERNIEIKCNKFAAHYLLPDSAFEDDIIYYQNSKPSVIAEIAKKYSVSKEVILRRLLDYRIVSNEYYKKMSARWNEEYLKREYKSGGGNYYLTKLSYLGEGFTKLAFENYKRYRFSEMELANHLNMNSRYLPKLESYISW